MELQCLAGLVVLAVAGFIWQDANAIACLSTKILGSDEDVSSLESIGQIEECGPTEVCFVEKFIYEEAPQNLRYRAGCRDVSECKLIGCSNNVTEPIPTHRTKRSDDITLCTECCYSDTCNIKGCNASAIDETKPFKKCFSCTDIKPNDTRTCNEMDYCGAAEMCAVEADYTKRVYNLKCAKTKVCEAALIAANVSGKLALKCFDGHLKNFNPISNHTDKVVDDILPCPTGLVPTTPTTTTQLTTLTPITSSTTTPPSTAKLTTFTTQTKTTIKMTTMPPYTPTSTLQTPKLPPVSTAAMSTPKPSPLVTSTLLTPKLPPLITTTQPTTKLIIAPTLPSIPKTTAPSSPTSTLIPSSPVTATPKPPTIPVSFVNVTISQNPTTKVVITTTTSTPATTSTMPTTTTTKPLTTTTTLSSIPTTPTTTVTTPATTTITQTTTPTTPPSTSTTAPTTPTTPATTTTTQSTTPTTPTTTTTTPTTSTIQTTTTRRTTTPLTTTIRTTTPAPAPAGHTIPPNPTTCFVCLDDAPDMCEDLYVETDCQPPNNYCINEIKNFADGSKTVNRTCGNFDRCYKDWYHGSSDKDVCQNFDETQYITLDFECVYCCVQDMCNDPMKPYPDTLYEDK